MKFLKPKIVEVFGEKCTNHESTKNLKTDEFKRYLDNIQMLASVQLGIDLPDPDHKHFTDFYKEFC